MPSAERNGNKSGSLPFAAAKKSERKSSAKKLASSSAAPPEDLSPAAQQLEQALKGWRTAVAKKLGMPPFVVLHDKTLRAIAHARPTTPNQLQEIPGMGPAKVDKYSQQILEICGQS